MKAFRMILIAFLAASCASPRLTIYDGPKVAKGKGIVVECELLTGERFEFNEPGAVLVRKEKIFFGKTPSHDFITVAYDQRQRLFSEKGDPIAGPDSSSRIYKIVQPGFPDVDFLRPGARYYESSLFISGPAMNGNEVLLPIDQVIQSENLRNLEALKRQAGFVTVLSFFACVGLLTLYTLAKLQESR